MPPALSGGGEDLGTEGAVMSKLGEYCVVVEAIKDT